MDDDSHKIGGRLKARRLELQLTQNQLARMSGVSQQTIHNIEAGRNSSSRHLVKLADALSVSPHWLEQGDEGDAPGHITSSGGLSFSEQERRMVEIFRALDKDRREVAELVLRSMVPVYSVLPPVSNILRLGSRLNSAT
jgi:transcriptional regulator with XRE-family HTH domain